MRATLFATGLFAVIVWDLTMNHGRGFRTASSIIAYSLRQLGLA